MNYSYKKSRSILLFSNRMQFLLLLSALIFVINNAENKAQTLAPLSLGNMWVYQESDTSEQRIKFLIADTVTIDSNTYFICKQSGKDSVERYFRLREDGVYVFYNKGSEYPYFKTNFTLNDTLYHQEWYGRWSFIVNNETEENLFDSDVTVKDIFINMLFIRNNERWTEEFGLISGMDIYGNSYSILKGCVINGTVYGDTTTVLTGIGDELPENNFILSQNYPNPFNPVTTINYQIPENGMVTLKVYDILGKEITTLVNDFKTKGRYEVKFDGSSAGGGLASGVYIYRIAIHSDKINMNSFTESKKFVLMK